MQLSTLPLWQRLRCSASAEHLALGFSLFLALASNRMFWQSALAGHTLAQWHDVLFAVGQFAFITAAHFLLLLLLLNRWSYRPLLGLLSIATAFAVYFMEK